MRSEELQHSILDRVKAYYREVFEAQPAFRPGESFVNYGGRVFDAQELINLTEAALDFRLTAGRFVRQFEEGLRDYLDVPHVLAVNSGSSANLLAFMGLTSPQLGARRIQRGDEVLTVAAGFPTTVAPVIQYGAIPVFVDIDQATLNVAVDQLESSLSPKTKAVMLAHTLGNPFALDRVKAFCDTHGLWLIEDNCDALGSRFQGKMTGTFGDIGTSSFYPPHHITMGEGGAVYTGNPELYRILLSMRDWGRDCRCESGRDNTCRKRFSGQFGTLPFGYDHKYVYSHMGYNLKITEMQAAVGVAQLQKLPAFVRSRQSNHKRLQDALTAFGDCFTFMETLPQASPSWFGFFITLRDHCPFSRNEIVAYLEKRRIQTRHLFAGNLTRHPCFAHLLEGRDYRISGSLMNTDKVMHDGFWIGVYPGMDRPRMDYIIATIRAFMEEHA